MFHTKGRTMGSCLVFSTSSGVMKKRFKLLNISSISTAEVALFSVLFYAIIRSSTINPLRPIVILFRSDLFFIKIYLDIFLSNPLLYIYISPNSFLLSLLLSMFISLSILLNIIYYEPIGNSSISILAFLFQFYWLWKYIPDISANIFHFRELKLWILCAFSLRRTLSLSLSLSIAFDLCKRKLSVYFLFFLF